MEIFFTKISDEEYSVRIQRSDGSEDIAILKARSFLRHDLAHFSVESEIPLPLGYWGSVSQGASLDGKEIRGPDIVIAEKFAGPVQTLMRIEADAEKFYSTLSAIRSEMVSKELANRIRETGRRLQGHWKATPYGQEMKLKWDESLSGTY